MGLLDQPLHQRRRVARHDVAGTQLVTGPVQRVIDLLVSLGGVFGGHSVNACLDRIELPVQSGLELLDLRLKALEPRVVLALELAVEQIAAIAAPAALSAQQWVGLEHVYGLPDVSFALLPDPNPSGNFTKITQRLPLRVKLLDKDAALRPGMMVEVYVATGNR